jgi:SAM-dependent methyltransferase
LLAELPPAAGARALDVGCGAGRWCRLLASHGYDVQGIDLQDALIERNRRRYPTMKFHSGPIQDFTPDGPFDLVTHVTVIQHLPFDEQPKALAKIASIVKPGGHVLSLENVADQGAHVFANSIDGWTRAFADVGFDRVALRRYDYSPATRLSTTLVNVTARAARAVGLMKPADGAGAPRAPTADGLDEGGFLRRAVRSAGWASRRLAVSVDEPIERFLVGKNLNLPTVHCGFLFRKSA